MATKAFKQYNVGINFKIPNLTLASTPYSICLLQFSISFGSDTKLNTARIQCERITSNGYLTFKDNSSSPSASLINCFVSLLILSERIIFAVNIPS